MKPNFKLEDLPRENVYRVPEQYFDKLPNRIMQRVTNGAEIREPAWLGLPAKLRLALAGTGFAAVFATIFLLNFNNITPDADLLAQVSQDEIVSYLVAYDLPDRSDLTILNATDQDMTAQFIGANPSEIRRELEEQQYEDIYL